MAAAKSRSARRAMEARFLYVDKRLAAAFEEASIEAALLSDGGLGPVRTEMGTPRDEEDRGFLLMMTYLTNSLLPAVFIEWAPKVWYAGRGY
jgi:hypothetical protein